MSQSLLIQLVIVFSLVVIAAKSLDTTDLAALAIGALTVVLLVVYPHLT